MECKAVAECCSRYSSPRAREVEERVSSLPIEGFIRQRCVKNTSESSSSMDYHFLARLKNLLERMGLLLKGAVHMKASLKSALMAA